MSVRKYFMGVVSYELVGAMPEDFMNRLVKNGIPIWNIVKEDELRYTFCTYSRWKQELQRIADRCCCELFFHEEQGLRQNIRRLLHRPFLMISVLAALVMSFYLQSIIWIVDIQAGVHVDEDRLRHELQEMGIQVWADVGDLDLQQLRYELLNRIPELSWVAVNRQGGRIGVMALGRENREETNRFQASHLFAARDGVITQSEVLEGMALCKVGDSVKQGQLLVSGLEDFGLYMKAVDAKGEIYGQTWYSGTLVTPRNCYKKRYTGRRWTEQSILFGRKRINLSGSSSILGVLCDKMIDTKQLSLPGFRFPLTLQRITYREYTLESVSLSSMDAKELLALRWSHSLMSAMVAGRIEHTDSVCFENGGLYIMQSESVCHELLSRTMPLEPPYEGEMPEWNASLMQKE